MDTSTFADSSPSLSFLPNKPLTFPCREFLPQVLGSSALSSERIFVYSHTIQKYKAQTQGAETEPKPETKLVEDFPLFPLFFLGFVFDPRDSHPLIFLFKLTEEKKQRTNPWEAKRS
jgi:hypothetical protein